MDGNRSCFDRPCSSMVLVRSSLSRDKLSLSRRSEFVGGIGTFCLSVPVFYYITDGILLSSIYRR